MASCNTVLQTIVQDKMRGRVMSLFSMAFMGMAPFGSLFSGALAARVGAPATFAICGSICLASAYAFSKKLPELRKHLKTIYQEKGILPLKHAN
jgi:MFS family permease